MCSNQHIKYQMPRGFSLTISLLLDYHIKQYTHADTFTYAYRCCATKTNFSSKTNDSLLWWTTAGPARASFEGILWWVPIGESGWLGGKPGLPCDMIGLWPPPGCCWTNCAGLAPGLSLPPGNCRCEAIKYIWLNFQLSRQSHCNKQKCYENANISDLYAINTSCDKKCYNKLVFKEFHTSNQALCFKIPHIHYIMFII